ncbi:unnamed protein product [Moneuplotes crassus]|uniref:Uncharacterized protein n=1 Tax=Euplotes crassus TaxID=5936 RepID=A0AAD1Y645_EUPCR|nr:unnamed protein product [Moneuplotes crassus]
MKLLKPQSDDESECSPIKTKTKYYRKLLNFYDKSSERRPKSASSPKKSQDASPPKRKDSEIKIELDISKNCQKLMRFSDLMENPREAQQRRSNERNKRNKGKSKLLQKIKENYQMQMVQNRVSYDRRNCKRRDSYGLNHKVSHPTNMKTMSDQDGYPFFISNYTKDSGRKSSYMVKRSCKSKQNSVRAIYTRGNKRHRKLTVK